MATHNPFAQNRGAKTVLNPVAAPPQLIQGLSTLDRYLNPKFLGTLSLKDAQALLVHINTLHQQANTYLANGGSPEVVAAGCRLASDLTEAIHLRLADIVRHHDAEIDHLAATVRQRMQERLIATHLLKQVMATRHTTQQTADAAGLGMVL